MIDENAEQQKYDDSKEIVSIDYYDRINRKWIKLDVTKEDARFMKADDQKTRRNQNRYDYYNKPYDEIFDEDNHPENMQFLMDEEQDPYNVLVKKHQELIKDAQIEEQRTIIQNSLDTLTPAQREAVEMVMNENMSYKEIGNRLGIDKSSVYERMKNAKKNIRNYIKNTEN